MLGVQIKNPLLNPARAVDQATREMINSSFFHSIENGDAEDIKELIDSNRLTHLTMGEGLLRAVQTNHPEIVQVLLENKAFYPAYINAASRLAETKNQPDLARNILENGQKIDMGRPDLNFSIAVCFASLLVVCFFHSMFLDSSNKSGIAVV